MKKLWAAALLLFIGGCLPAPPGNVTPAPAFAVLPAPETAPLATPPVSVAADLPLSPSVPAPAAVAADELTADVVAVDAADEPVEIAEDPLATDEALALALALAEDEEEELLPADPETLEDTLLLTAQDVAPPEEEGEAVAPGVSFDFPVVKNDKVNYFIDYFSGPGHKVFHRWLERSARYLPMMRQVFAEEGLPQDLVYVAMIESGFNNRAYSWAHAAGPWQFIESTGRIYGLNNNWWRDERRDPVKATRAAARHLKDLYALFEGDWYLAVAAYNAGGGKIGRAVHMYGTRDFWQLTHGSYLAVETKHYVPKLLAAMLIAKEPEKYGFADLVYHEPLAYETVKLPAATDVEIIAELCGTKTETIKDLNPELKRWCTPPGVEGYEVRLPPGGGEGFLDKYAQIPEDQRVNYRHHTVRKGDTLKSIARRYGIRSKDILALNRVRNTRSLKVGSELLLPFSKDGKLMADVGDDYERSSRPAPRTYKVRKGDSLWKIARKFDVSEKELRSWNRLGKKSGLRPGQTLVVAAGGKPAAAAKKAIAKKSTAVSRKQIASAKKPSVPARKVVHKVKRGDTLYAIARQYNVNAREIMDWNNLNKGHVLRPGERLTLRVREERRGG